MAPTYANVFVAQLEERFVNGSHHAEHLLAWWRYIDDVFLVWTWTENELTDFHIFLNEMDPDIKCTLVSSKVMIQFLDTQVVLREGRLHTKLFVKPTDRNTLLKFDSAHARSMIKSLPRSQLLRVKKIVDVESEVEESLNRRRTEL